MTGIRGFAFAALALVTACASPSPQQRADDAELAQLAPLKTQYSGVVMGFDIHPKATLVVSLDLQSYIAMDDEAVEAMKRTVLARWRAAWIAAHPDAHATLHVHFIDFIGRSVATETTKV